MEGEAPAMGNGSENAGGPEGDPATGVSFRTPSPDLPARPRSHAGAPGKEPALEASSLLGRLARVRPAPFRDAEPGAEGGLSWIGGKLEPSAIREPLPPEKPLPLEICSTGGGAVDSGSTAARFGVSAVPSGKTISASARFPALSATVALTLSESAVPASQLSAPSRWRRRIGTFRHSCAPRPGIPGPAF